MANTTPSSKTDWVASLGLLRSLAMYRARPWRQRLLERFYANLVQPGALVFDVGAHVGHRTDALLTCGARCVALEPQPLFADYLQRRYANDTRVTLIRDAVGRAPGTAHLAVSRRHPTVSTLSTRWIEQVGNSAGFTQVRWDQQVEVRVTTLDALITEHGMPDFCKIDVEGMEADILAGLTVSIPCIAVEYIPAALDVALACIDRLDTLGHYYYDFSVGESHHFLSPGQLTASEARQALHTIASNGRSGDIYAHLQPSPADAPQPSAQKS